MEKDFTNPFRPGAGHKPPYLAGRVEEKEEFKNLLKQEVVLNNLILTGLRGVGKTVLLDSFKSIAQESGWMWAGTDCSESASINEDTIALRLLTDIALITSNIVIHTEKIQEIGFTKDTREEKTYLSFSFLRQYYNAVPGLPIDKLKAVSMFVWDSIKSIDGVEGIVFAYDEAQTLSDHADDRQYPLSILLDLFQYLQRNGVKFVLVLTGLPTLLTKLVETRTYSERLFHVLTLRQLNDQESRDAILKPIADARCKTKFNDESVKIIIQQSGGYPYFIQFICREVYDVFEQKAAKKQKLSVPIDAIIQKLDNDFFAGRWSRATEREQQVLIMLAEANKTNFTIQDTLELSNKSRFKKFSRSQIGQLFNSLIERGLVYKDKRGSYSFAVPLLNQYIVRTQNTQPY
ncbi:AAA family ATPase [Candidatus Saccharibacteria bacterium]|nr:AAA family ATPase [Candidatus Saccharibacteria bacterium]